jgi:hypothetical protein
MNRLLFGIAALLAASPANALKVTSLRCDAQEKPIAIATAKPEFSWLLDPDKPAQKNLRQSAYRILVASSRNLIDRNRGDAWDSGKVPSDATFRIPYRGKPLAAGAAYYWKAQVWDQADAPSTWSGAATFGMGLLPGDWKAHWISASADGQRMPIFRHEVNLDGRIQRAIAYASGLGQYELRINGSKVGDAVLTPGWTNYRKSVLYNSYDVTSSLKQGRNAIGLLLGNGFFNVPAIPGRYTKLTSSFGRPLAIVQIHVTLADGKTVDILSGPDWKTVPGPITFSHEYGGEDYDARLDPAGWDQPGFKDRDWQPVHVAAAPGGTLTAQTIPDIRVMREFPSRKMTEPKPGVRLYDLGQNMSGWPRIGLRGPAGVTVKMIPAELLDSAGLATQRSSGSPMWWTYTLKGSGDETWSPRFMYYGFRYLQVEADPAVEIRSVAGQFVHSAAPVTGEFSCSKDLFNRIHRLILAAIESNMQSVLTDCPHREKLGWLEESHLLGSSVMYNYDVSRLYRKIAGDIAQSQTADGLVPDIAPEYTVFAAGFRDSPEWGSAAILDPWLAYQHFGDLRNLAEHYEDMRRYASYLGNKAASGILSYGLGDWYDIGPKPPGVAQLTSLSVTATGIYYADLTVLRDVAKLLAKDSDAHHYEQESEAVRQAFNEKLLNRQTGVYDRGSQTAYAMPLSLGLVPRELRAGALEKLVADVRARGNHTSAGDIGYHFVIRALSKGGRSDVIYDMLANPNPPSYAGQLAAGATTLTEAWDCNPHSSQNHFMLGHAEEWFYRYLAGIDFDLSRPPGEQIILRPTVVGDVTSARATYRSVLGTISISWTRRDGKFICDFEVPVNARAKVILPGRTETVGSGNYHVEI